MQKIKTLKEIKKILCEKNLSLTSAESCTGGLVSSYLTDIAGSSKYIFQNFVTYSNEAKNKFLKVKKETLDKYGAVSEQTAVEMAEGLFQYGDISIATTGILGPDGGSAEKPIGLCYIGLGCKKTNKIKTVKYISKIQNNRVKIKEDIAKRALLELLKFLKSV